LQIRAVVLGNRDCNRGVSRLGPDAYNALAMCDAAHNGGYAAMLNERRICAQVPGCDPNPGTAGCGSCDFFDELCVCAFQSSCCDTSWELPCALQFAICSGGC